MASRYQKLISSALLLSVIFSLAPVTPFLKAQKAEAQFVPVHDLLHTGISLDNLAQTLLEWVAKFVLETLRKRILDMIVDQIIVWIQGGGKPQFITDWNAFFDNAFNDAAGEFIEKELGAGFLCGPLQFQIQVALLPVPKFAQPATCTLDQIVGNINDFYKNFTTGGWLAYNTSLEPQNNFFGVKLMATAELYDRTIQAQGALGLEGLSGGGFLSTKDCSEPSVCSNPGTQAPECAGPDTDDDGIPGDIGSSCLTVTPGDTIGKLTAQAIGVDIPYILSSQELAGYLSAIVNALINKLIISGVQGIKGLSTPNAPPGGAITGGSGPCAGLSGVLLSTCLNLANNSGNNFTAAQSQFVSQIDSVLQPRVAADTVITASLQALANYKTSLTALLAQAKNFLPACPDPNVDIGQIINNINNELLWATNMENQLIADQGTNNAIITSLNQYKAQIQALQADDWIGLSNITSQLQASGLLDVSGATTFKAAQDANYQDITAQAAKKLPQIQSQITDCSFFPP